MPGTFSKAARPLRPGSYFNWIAQAQAPVPPSVGTIVAIPFTSDWGPLKTPTLVGSFSEYLAVFGPTVGTPGYIAAWQAFMGEGGFEGRYGAGAVLCYRMGGSAVAKATKVLQNTTPANALTLTARYEGTYGANVSVTVQDHIADATKDELLVLVGTQIVETYVYTDTDITGLVAQINGNSSWVTAAMTITGVKLGYVSSQALTGGNDGTTTLLADWSAQWSTLETQQFAIYNPYGLTDPTTLAALKAWAGGASSGVVGRNAKGQRFEVVVGGVTDEDVATANTAAGLLADGNFMRTAMGHIVDQNLLDVNGRPVTLSPAQWSSRVAGVLAQRGEAMSVTSARFPGWTLVNGPNESDIASALNGGLIVLSQDSDPDAPVHIEAARTTFTAGGPNGSTALAGYPYLIYRNPKFMRTMQAIEVEFQAWSNRTLIGKLPVNNKTRESAIAEIQARLRAREGVGIIQSGWSVQVDQNPPPSDQDEFIALQIGLKFGRSVEQVFYTVNVQ